MGSLTELNDTLQITSAQGFPEALKLERHLNQPYTAEEFADKIFAFKDKPGTRRYHESPVRNFLVENRHGKWIYWGLIEVLTVTHDYQRKMTSGTFRLRYLYTPEEMKIAHALIDRNPETDFFGSR